MGVVRVTEISATSPEKAEDAIRQGLERATKALRGVTTTCRHLISAATHRQFRADAFRAWREAAELAA